jgi:hypothetical protein
MRRAAIASCVLWLIPFAVAAQSSGGAPAPQTQGPMIVERVHGGLLIAPDFKITEVDDRTSELAGGYAGWLTDDTIFIGGGGYWLANQASDRKLAYGGLMLQWLAIKDRRVGFSAKGLVGGGRATLGTNLSRLSFMPDITNAPARGPSPADLDRLTRGSLVDTRIRYRQDFFVAEPEVDVLVRLTNRLRLSGGVGYRFVSAEMQGDDRLRGVTGSIGLQIGGGS